METMAVNGQAWRVMTCGGWVEIFLSQDAVAGADEDGIEYQRYN